MSVLSFTFVTATSGHVERKETCGVRILLIKLYQINFRNMKYTSFCEINCTIYSDKVSFFLKLTQFSTLRYNDYK